LTEKPIQGAWKAPMKIPIRRKKEPLPEPNGTALTNGKHPREDTTTEPAKRPRADDAGEPSAKKAKTAPADDDVVIIDDSAGGAIVIDD
jgi:ubiquitin-like 1-activating enzyme E1 B